MNQLEGVMDEFRIGSQQYGDFIIIHNDEDIPSERVVLDLISAALTIAFEVGKRSDSPPVIKQLRTSLKRMGDSDSLPESLRSKDVLGFSANIMWTDSNTLFCSEYGDCVILEPEDVAPSASTMTVLLEKALQFAGVFKESGAIRLSDIKVIIRPLPDDIKQDPDDRATIGFKCRIVSERSMVMDALFGVNDEAPSSAATEEGGASV